MGDNGLKRKSSVVKLELHHKENSTQYLTILIRNGVIDSSKGSILTHLNPYQESLILGLALSRACR